MLVLRSLAFGGWTQLCAAALCFNVLGVSMGHAAESMEERKLPMRFSWTTEVPEQACKPNCRGWVSAVGVITGDTVEAFNAFARERDLRGGTIVLDSGGGSVLDAIMLGRRWRELRVSTTVGISVATTSADGADDGATVMPDAYCESMCVFLLLSGVNRYVPPTAHVRVHQIWMGDRADDARAATYSAQDLMIVERDIGRLAKYTFDMGGAGDLLALALSIPPWENLHELSADELRLTRVVSVDTMAAVMPRAALPVVASGSVAKPVQDRMIPDKTRTAEALPHQTGGATLTKDGQ